MRVPQIVSSRVVLVTVLASVLAGCANNAESDEEVPLWVTEMIRQMEQEPVSNPPSYLARYEYAGATVYYVPPHCCDVASSLYDETGTLICGPDGGLSGRGDGRYPDFGRSGGTRRSSGEIREQPQVRTFS